MFFVGQKVVCVDATWGCPTGHPLQRSHCPNLLVEGGVYHIRELRECRELHVVLVEVRNPVVHMSGGAYVEPCFEACKYRPLTDTQQSISFTQGAPRDSRKWDNRRHVAPKRRVGGKQKERV